MEMGVAVAVAVLLLTALATDLYKQTIPNRLTLSFFGAALLYQFAAHNFAGLSVAMAGAAAGFVPLLLLYLCKGIGAGDVKLFATIGAWVGAWPVLYLMFYAILYAGAIGLCLLVLNRSFNKKVAYELTVLTAPDAGLRKQQWLRWAESGKKFPFMLAVAPAAVTVWLLIN
jgi:prepilin peptidase CpaA